MFSNPYWASCVFGSAISIGLCFWLPYELDFWRRNRERLTEKKPKIHRTWRFRMFAAAFVGTTLTIACALGLNEYLNPATSGQAVFNGLGILSFLRGLGLIAEEGFGTRFSSPT